MISHFTVNVECCNCKYFFCSNTNIITHNHKLKKWNHVKYNWLKQKSQGWVKYGLIFISGWWSLILLLFLCFCSRKTNWTLLRFKFNTIYKIETNSFSVCCERSHVESRTADWTSWTNTQTLSSQFKEAGVRKTKGTVCVCACVWPLLQINKRSQMFVLQSAACAAVWSVSVQGKDTRDFPLLSWMLLTPSLAALTMQTLN